MSALESAVVSAQRQRSKDSSKETHADKHPDRPHGVGTRYAESRDAILSELKHHPDYTYTSGELFEALHMEDEKLKKLGHAILSRLVKAGKITRMSRGM